MATLGVELDATAVGVAVENSVLKVSLADGRELLVPLGWFPRLNSASGTQLANWRFIGRGEGIHWPDLDEDVSVAGLMRVRHRGISKKTGTAA